MDTSTQQNARWWISTLAFSVSLAGLIMYFRRK